jgi:hypothetical protein
MLDETTFEDVRDRFFKATNLDIRNLEPGEVRDLLELLPLAIAALHTEYDLVQVYARDQDDSD